MESLHCRKAVAIAITLQLLTVISPAPGIYNSAVKNGAYRSVVSVQRNKGLNLRQWRRRWIHICEGVIVTQSIILTACRCLMNTENPPKLRKVACNTRVEAGNGNLNTYNGFRQVRRVEEFLPHPKCGLTVLPDQNQWHHDVGLMVLQYDLIFNPEIESLKLLNKGLFEVDQEQAVKELTLVQKEGVHTCLSSGWLITSTDTEVDYDPDNEGRQKPRKRNDVKMQLLNPETCKKRLCTASKYFCSHFDEYDPICAYTSGSVCSEVSGGPLFCDGSFYGTVSNRTGCSTGTPLVFTSIKPILELINGLGPKYKHRAFRPEPDYIVCQGETYIKDKPKTTSSPFDDLRKKIHEEAKKRLEKKMKSKYRKTRTNENAKAQMSLFDKLREQIHKKAESLKI